MRTVYGRETSSNVQLVLWCLDELGLEATRVDAGGAFGGLDTEAFRAMNPHGAIPVLVEPDGTALWESGAIVRYLAARNGDARFWPPDPAARAALDMWAEWVKTALVPLLTYRVFWQLIRVAPSARDDDAIAAAVEELKGAMAILDNRLGDGPWLGGEDFTWADLLTGHLLYRYYALPIARAETPALGRYYERLSKRPAFARRVMVSYEPLRVRDP